MKSLSLLGALVLIVLNGHAQIEILNASLTEPAAAILYAAVDNKIVLQNTATTATYELKTSTSLLERLSATEFILKANHRIPSDTLFVYENDKLVLQKVYKIKVLAPTIIHLGTLNSDVATKADIAKNASLIATNESLYKLGQNITGFELKILDANGAVLHNFEMTEGRALTQDQLNIVAKLNAGDQLVFGEIKAVGADGIGRVYRGFVITVL